MSNVSLTDYILEKVGAKNYTKEEIDTLLTTINSKDLDLFKIVSELPTEDIENKLYLTPTSNGGGLFDVYLYVDDDWEQLDKFNLTGYYTSTQMDNLLLSKASKNDLYTLRSNLEDTRDSLTSLYNNLTNFNKELVDFSDENNNLYSDLGKLSENVACFISRVNTLISSVDSLEDATDTVTRDILSTKSDINLLRLDLDGDDESNPPVKGLKEDLSDTKSSLTSTRNSLNLAQVDIVSLQNANSSMSNRLDTLDNDLSDLSDELPSIKSDITSLQGKDTELTNGLESLGDTVTSMGESLEDTKDNLTLLDTQLNGDSSNPSDTGLSGSLNNLSDTVNGFGTEINNLKQADTRLSNNLNNLDTQLNGDTNDPSDNGLVGDLTDLRSSNTSLISGLQTLTGNVTLLFEALDDGHEGLVNVQTEIVHFDEELSNFINDLELLGTALSDFEGDLSDFIRENDDLVLSSFSLNSSITELFVNIGKVRSDVSDIRVDLDGDGTSNNRGLKASLGDVETSLYGDTDDPSDNGLVGLMEDVTDTIGDTDTPNTVLYDLNNSNGRVGTVNNRIDTVVDSAISEVNSSISEVETNINTINNTIGDTDTPNTILYDINDADTRITNVNNTLTSTRNELTESIGYINNVQKLLYGDSTYYYSCNNQTLTEYTIDTSDVTGLNNLKFIVYPSDIILITDISVGDGDFTNDLSDWEVNGDVTVITIDNTKYAKITSDNQVSILCKEDLDFTDLDSISFKVKVFANMNTEVRGGVFAYIGTEEDTGLIKGLSEFKVSLDDFNDDLDELGISVENLDEDITDLQDDLYGGDEYSFESPQTGSYVDLLNTTSDDLGVAQQDILDSNARIDDLVDNTIPSVEGRIELITNTGGTGSLDILEDNLSSLGSEVSNVNSSISSVKTTVFGKADGDESDYTSNSLYGDVESAKSSISTVQSSITSINSSITGLESDITNANERIDTVTNGKGTGSLDDLIERIGNNERGLIKKANDIETDVTNISNGIGSNSDNITSNTIWGKINKSISDINSITNILGEENDTGTKSVWSKINNLLTGTTNAITSLYGKADGDTSDYTSNSIWGRIQNLLHRVSISEEILYDEYYNEIICNGYETLSIDTSNITGTHTLKLRLKGEGDLQISPLDYDGDDFPNFNFTDGFDGWSISDDDKVVLDSFNLLVLSPVSWISRSVDFTDIDEVNYLLEKLDNNPCTLIITIGDGLIENTDTVSDAIGDNSTPNTILYDLNNNSGSVSNRIGTVDGKVDVLDVALNGDGTNNNVGLITEVSGAKSNINSINNKIGDTSTPNTILYNIHDINGDIVSINSDVSDINTDIGEVQRSKGGNLQNQVATLLALLNNTLPNCVIVDTLNDMENLNYSYAQYCYVRANGKFYTSRYDIVYYDNRGNVIPSSQIREDILLTGDDAEEVINEKKAENSLGSSMLSNITNENNSNSNSNEDEIP